MTNQIEVLKNGLNIGGRRYNDGDILEPSHHTHDVLRAVDQKSGPLKDWVKRRRVTAKEKNAPRAAQGSPVALEAEMARESEGAAVT